MTRIIGVYLLIIAIIKSNCCLAQTDTILQLDHIAAATVLLEEPNVGSGSGTIIKQGTRFYILTAAHVAKLLSDKSTITFPTANDSKQSVALKNLVVGHQVIFQVHPLADLALVEIIPTPISISETVNANAIPYELIHSERESVPRHLEVYALGYPFLDVKGEFFSPLSFKTNPSSGLLNRPRLDTGDTCVFFFLQAPSVQGFSGGGVYLGVFSAIMFIKRTFLIGVTHGTVGDNTGGKFEAVTPAFYIKDLFSDR